ncbi:hypothetical protein [Mangrovicoccus ximenensis]|uniref:hypothetical protein n=1 Tax=Mangrovicoccus ximenensis TaxID=1911570 RepID=UPI000D35FF35|nr:hypothetical protein [Mangrovicoccus ximenensis]
MRLRPALILAAGLLVPALLAGCSLDSEEALRQHLSQWFSLAGTRNFVSKSSCTLAVFHIDQPSVAMEGGLTRASDSKTALELVEAGTPVLFEFPGRSPTEISETLMTEDLARGLGLLSSGIGPVLDCAEGDGIRKGVYRILVSKSARMLYEPDGNALILVYPPERLAVFMRGNV